MAQLEFWDLDAASRPEDERGACAWPPWMSHLLVAELRVEILVQTEQWQDEQ